MKLLEQYEDLFQYVCRLNRVSRTDAHSEYARVRSEVKTRVKRAVEATEAGAEDATDSLRQAVKRIDKAAAKGIIHKNQAANRKARLMKRLARPGGPAT